MPENMSNEPQYKYSNHLVVFLDLMGQSKKLESIEGILNSRTPENEIKLKNTLRDTLGAIWLFRKDFANVYENCNNLDRTWKPSPSHHDDFMRFRGYSDIHFQGFSDSIVIWTPLEIIDENDYLKALKSIYTILASIGLIQPLYLSRGIPIRGGAEIEGAVQVRSGGNEIYGPALNRAYCLESKLAHYPRVLIGGGLLEFLNAVPTSNFQDPSTKIFCEVLIKASKDWIFTDSDGQQMIHFLGPEASTTMAKSFNLEKADTQFLIEMETFVQECLIKYEDDTKIGPKYKRLNEYLKNHLPKWKK